MDRIYPSYGSMFIFLCGQENEPKEAARVPGPFGLPCASRSRRDLKPAVIFENCHTYGDWQLTFYYHPMRSFPQKTSKPSGRARQARVMFRRKAVWTARRVGRDIEKMTATPARAAF